MKLKLWDFLKNVPMNYGNLQKYPRGMPSCSYRPLKIGKNGKIRKFKTFSFKKLESSQKRFLENESSTYRWKRVLRREKYRWNFKIMFCLIFIKEIMAEKSKKRSNSADKKSSKNFWDTFWKISPILFFEGHFQGSLLKISEPTDVLAGLWSFLKKKNFRFFSGS